MLDLTSDAPGDAPTKRVLLDLTAAAVAPDPSGAQGQLKPGSEHVEQSVASVLQQMLTALNTLAVRMERSEGMLSGALHGLHRNSTEPLPSADPNEPRGVAVMPTAASTPMHEDTPVSLDDDDVTDCVYNQ